MKTIKAERITKDNFAPYGRYYNVFEERKTESEDFTAYMLRELHTDEPMNFGITICKAGGIWHDANHGIDKDTMYYFMATNKAPDSRETEWVQVSPEPVHVLVHQGGAI